MRIEGAAPADVSSVSPPRREVPPTRTSVTRGDIRAAIARALERETGARADARTVDVLTAHASLETASGDRMYNFNFAGIKGRSPSGATAVLRTKEVIDGKEISIRDGFRAYATIDEGALDYVRLMRGKFRGALEPAARGDLDGFAHALKKAGYYTAAEADYARGLANVSGAARAEGASATRPSTVRLPSGSDLARAFDALDAERWGLSSTSSTAFLDPFTSTSLDALSGASLSPRARHARERDDDEEG